MKLALGIAVAIVLCAAGGAGGASRSPGEHDPGSSPQWSPGGTLLTFTRKSRSFVAQSDGSRQRFFPAAGGTWSPDGRHLAFWRPPGAIWVGRPDGSDARLVARGWGFSWSPDSEMLVVANDGLSTVHRDGSGLRQITTPPPCTTCYGRSHHQPAWSPDGKWISYVEVTTTTEARGVSHVHVVKPDGTEDRAIEADSFLATGPSWSPDSRWLLYTDDYDSTGDPEIFIARVDAGFTVRRLGKGEVGIWAPKSRLVAHEPAFSRDLFVTRPEGGSTRIRNASHPSWSPDGSLLAFQRGPNVVVARPDGTRARVIARGLAPSFSSKGEIAYRSVRCGAGQGIHAVLPTGRGDRRITTACTIVGRYPNDTINGGLERQSVTAGHGDDLVHGNGGNDVLDGGPGDDVVYGDDGRDVLVGGSEVDRLFGGRGSDLIRARDRWRDSIGCGPGRDTVVADAIDLVAADCEVVRRG